MLGWNALQDPTFDISLMFQSDTDLFGGEGGIRTHDTLAGIPDFESGRFNRSRTSPKETETQRAAGDAYSGKRRGVFPVESTSIQ